jgi:hypothetical protein
LPDRFDSLDMLAAKSGLGPMSASIDDVNRPSRQGGKSNRLPNNGAAS